MFSKGDEPSSKALDNAVASFVDSETADGDHFCMFQFPKNLHFQFFKMCFSLISNFISLRKIFEIWDHVVVNFFLFPKEIFWIVEI